MTTATPPATVNATVNATVSATDGDLDTQAENAEAIPTLRAQIDALDTAIINLVAERVRLSQRIQTARINSGGARVELGRERVILDAYRSVLGPQGGHLAESLLQVCRGAR